MNLSDVYVFKKVAATLSFTKAARQIGVSRSAVSKQVSRLEHDLGVVLINRTTRSVNLTEAGRTFDCSTTDIDTTIERAADLVRGADLSPNGTVSFALPSGLGAALMPALTTEFQERWPELQLSINFDDGDENLIAANLDLAIRISKKLDDSSLISRRLATTRMVFAASPDYLQDHHTPENPLDLEEHRCIGLSDSAHITAPWRLHSDDKKQNIETRFALAANNSLALILAARLGSGIIYVPEILIRRELALDHLRVVLNNNADTELYGVYAVYPHRNAAAKVKVLVDFIEQQLKMRIGQYDGYANSGTAASSGQRTSALRAARDNTGAQ